MRIVILYNSSWYVFLLRRNLITSLQQAGHVVFVVAPEDQYSERVRQLGVTLLPIEMSRSGTSVWEEGRALGQIYTALKIIKPDVVLSFTAKCNLYAGLCKRKLSFRHVANVSGLGQLFDRGGALRAAAHLLYRISLGRTEEIFFQNREDLLHLTGAKAVPADRASLIPGSGVDLGRFRPGPKRTNEAKAILMFGRLLPKKGFYHFMKAAEELKKVHGERVVLWILGAADPERRESLELLDAVMDAHARGVIRYLQATDDPVPYILESDAVVLPSTYNEGVPRSLLEALACGKPIVTTNWKGCRETIENGKNGFLINPDSTESLIRALHALLQLDDASLQAFGERSRQIAEERFDERVVIDAYHRAVNRKSTVSSLELAGLTGEASFAENTDLLSSL